MQRKLADHEQQEDHMRTTAIAFALTLLPLRNATADDIGRLFFTPEQRMQLEREQAQRTTSTYKTLSAPMLNGIVQKNDGPRTIWVNGILQDAKGNNGHAPDIQTITPPGTSLPVLLKVGQRLVP